MMSFATLPLSFWDYALESAVRILNLVSTKKVNKTPYELGHGKVPNLSYLKIWGCKAHVKCHTPDKLQQRSVKCIFIGKETMGYYFYYPPENKIVVERMDNSKRGFIPMQVDLHLSKSQYATTSAEMKRIQNVTYDSAVGSIMYVVRCTRPDVVFAQNITSQFQQNSSEAHWTAVKNILKYLRNTRDTFLVYGGDPKAELQVKCYCNARFKTDRDDTKSQTGYVFVLNEGAVFIDELGVVPSNDDPIKLNYDNSAAIIMAKESGIQKGARHFKRKYHYVRECIETGKIDIVKVYTDDNLADLFTKALAGPKLTRHARSMGLCPASSFM
nr:hypothetical protein [Tanacetum cinerariifolium]